MKTFKQYVNEEGSAPTNSASAGAIDGIGVGERGEPGVHRKYQKKYTKKNKKDEKDESPDI